MITIIAGGRNERLTKADVRFLDSLKINIVISGGAAGIDDDAILYAIERGIMFINFPANWKNYGRAAGHIRNRQMARHADSVVLFPGGKGTENMRKTAKQLGLKVIERAREKPNLLRYL
jgi:hypothetical protein